MTGSHPTHGSTGPHPTHGSTGPRPIRPHRLSARVLTALALGGGGPEAVEALQTIQLSRNRMLTLAVVELARRAGHPEAESARTAYRLLAEIERAAPEAVRQLLAYPTVSAWLAATVAALHRSGPDGRRRRGGEPGHLGRLGRAGARPARLGLVAVAAAARAGLAVRVPPDATGPGPVLLLPSLGQARLPGAAGDALVLVPAPDGPVLARAGHRPPPGGGPTRWVALPRIECGDGAPRLRASLDGSGWRILPGGRDPRIMEEAHAVARNRWRWRLDAGWRLLARHHRPVADEVAAAVSALVPLRTPDGALVSGTFRDGFGAIAMSLPRDPRSVALTLAHEVQHAKLVGVMDAIPLVQPGVGELYYAPWRSDPRPLGALLHGAYAHLGVTAFWRTQRRVEERDEDVFTAQVAFARWRSATWAATEAVRQTGRLTPAGELLLDGMRGALREFLAEPVPERAQRRADALATRHRQRVMPGR